MNSKFTPQILAHRALRVLCTSAALGMCSVAATANAQDGESAAQKPFIMVLMDTSGSMEWTDEGDEEYPKDASGNSWSLRDKLIEDPNSSAPTYFGPCRVWKTQCNDYYRPTWNWSNGEDWLESEEQSASGDIRGTASNPSNYRLRNTSQPRHVTLKEILTGDMVLARQGETLPLSSLDPAVYGPGCWIVPRQRGTGVNGDVCGDDPSEFEKYPDHTDPQPHFQEVFDGQHANGLMDTMSRSAIFGLAMFDSYQHSKKNANNNDSLSKDWKGGEYGEKHIDDTMDSDFAGLKEGEGGVYDPNDPEKRNYNLGVFQMLAPKSLDMGADIAADVSNFVQYALVDAGYLNRSDKHKLKPSGSGSILGLPFSNDDEIVFSKDLDDFLKDYQLGKQPVARATPLAAAIYDIHQFFAEGNGSGNGPVMDDPYMECRPKQVIMLTDGTPEPERGDGAAPPLNDSLNSAFGYNKAQYPYSNTEDAIDYFVRDQAYGVSAPDANGDRTFAPTQRSGDSYLSGSWNAAKGSSDYHKALNYNPRVHVVGLTGLHLPTPGSSIPLEIQQEEEQIIKKMAEMAIAGRTCASYYLGDDYIPQSKGGTCDTSKQICLDERQANYITGRSGGYTYLARDTTTPQCYFPAAVFAFPTDPAFRNSTNLVERTTVGLQLLFNHIVSTGLSSRTRPTFVNRLDDATVTDGGQFRYFSGVNVEPGKVFWKGELYRQAHLCTPVPGMNTTTDIAAQVNDQAGRVTWDDGNRTVDHKGSRRIFTTFSQWSPHYFTTPPPASAYPGTLASRFSLGQGFRRLSANSSNDTFGSGHRWPETEDNVGWRIPVEQSDFQSIAATITTDGKSDFAYFHTDSVTELQYLVDEVNGRTVEKQGRALGAIFNGSPVAVEPPDRALPIDSYREYQSLYANRPSMLYVATTDGFLHALYAGALDSSAPPKPEDKVLNNEGDEVSKNVQREAWAYLPQMLHQKLAGFKGKHAYLLDGTPTVQDVRLCQSPAVANAYNNHSQACKATGLSDLSPYEGFLGAFQWRTVLVQGLGNAGEGYFAMDVTRPGGRIVGGNGSMSTQAPDPIPLWEFDPIWEHYQVSKLNASSTANVIAKTPTASLVTETIKNDCGINSTNETDAKFWNQSFMGRSVGEAAIGTVVVDADFDNNTTRLRRPIAVFSGGAADQNPGACREHRMGRAIYVVDLQTGSLLRRFVTYEDDDSTGSEKLFEHAVTGSPALCDGRPGSLVTRGFVGDATGRLFRIDMSNPDPAKWYVQLFFDPRTQIAAYDEHSKLGPAAFKPALAKSTHSLNNDLLVFYGLGEVGDLSVSGTKQLMIAVREKITATASGTNYRANIASEKVWHHEFDGHTGNNSDEFSEKLTGAPVVFNSGVYFTTYVEPTDDACAPGWSRIYGMTFQGNLDPANVDLSTNTPRGLFRSATAASIDRGQAKIPTGTVCVPSSVNGDCFAYEPQNAASLEEPIVVRGLTITQGQTCTADNLDPGSMDAANTQQPTLIAQSTSSKLSGDNSSAIGGGTGPGSPGGGATGNAGGIFAIEQDIAKTLSSHNPLSWSVIDN